MQVCVLARTLPRQWEQFLNFALTLPLLSKENIPLSEENYESALKYSKDEKPVTAFSDADWGGDLDDRHSTTGNLFLLAGGAVSWLSKKQAVVALSTIEAEYVALSLAAQEATWLQKLLANLRIPTEPIVIKEDNQGAVALAFSCHV